MTQYNPADHNVDAVKQYVSDNPAEAQAVLEAEQARGDDARSTLVTHLQTVVDEQPEVPVPAEPKPVTVQPADQSDVKTDKVFDKAYEVTPERGYRVQKSS